MNTVMGGSVLKMKDKWVEALYSFRSLESLGPFSSLKNMLEAPAYAEASAGRQS
jgi:hypothetical protein